MIMRIFIQGMGNSSSDFRGAGSRKRLPRFFFQEEKMMKAYKEPNFYFNGEHFVVLPNRFPRSEYEDRYNLLVQMYDGHYMRISTAQSKKAALRFVREQF